ncbi:hypothetical protein BLA29_009098 [Euroglyphus maynei]|uniref:Uncharacterized protein n=1 Tax=Euroglyphus maynei TaxID=6958 RepID=A0A1Y3BR64_EURMA|nr:hypothetical protein BLA29_009098 [Euroglyphus maynei]
MNIYPKSVVIVIHYRKQPIVGFQIHSMINLLA